jgi:hypothetical protein
MPFAVHTSHPVLRPNDADLDEVAAIINVGQQIAIYGGSGCRGAHDEILRVATPFQRPPYHSALIPGTSAHFYGARSEQIPGRRRHRIEVEWSHGMLSYSVCHPGQGPAKRPSTGALQSHVMREDPHTRGPSARVSRERIGGRIARSVLGCRLDDPHVQPFGHNVCMASISPSGYERSKQREPFGAPPELPQSGLQWLPRPAEEDHCRGVHSVRSSPPECDRAVGR